MSRPRLEAREALTAISGFVNRLNATYECKENFVFFLLFKCQSKVCVYLGKKNFLHRLQTNGLHKHRQSSNTQEQLGSGPCPVPIRWGSKVFSGIAVSWQRHTVETRKIRYVGAKIMANCRVKLWPGLNCAGQSEYDNLW